tara:strand:+ start:8346 stop:8519 length:174 start_codon:yes stop_codon:yes gene_type:complete
MAREAKAEQSEEGGAYLAWDPAVIFGLPSGKSTTISGVGESKGGCFMRGLNSKPSRY